LYVLFSYKLKFQEQERKDKMERALTKIEKYNTNSNGNAGK
jgi:hypothetical protein